MDNKTPAVKMRNITKTIGPLVANDKVWLDIYRGEILALLGENGSGKTTLMNMLSGIYFPDEGQIYIDGKEVVIRSPKDAFNYGIGMIHQHFKLVDVLTAAENIVLGLPGKLDLKEASRKIRDYIYSPWNSPGQNTGVGSQSRLQGIFPTQGSNPGLLHCRQILY